MINRGKCFNLLSNSPNSFFKEMFRDQTENLLLDNGALSDKSC